MDLTCRAGENGYAGRPFPIHAMSEQTEPAKMSYLEGHVTRVEPHGVEIIDTTEAKHFLYYQRADNRFAVGQVLHVRVHKDASGQSAIDAVV